MSAINYETVFIAEPEISNDQVDQLINKIKGAVATAQGTITGEDRWGRRRMAYAINAHKEGYYAVLTFTAEAGAVNAIEHLYNVTDSVIRHLTTCVMQQKNTLARAKNVRPEPAPKGPATADGLPVVIARARMLQQPNPQRLPPKQRHRRRYPMLRRRRLKGELPHDTDDIRTYSASTLTIK